MTLVAVGLPPTRDEWSSGPKRFRVVDRGVKFDHVGSGHNLVKNCEGRWPFRAAHSISFLLLGERHFDFDFTQSFNQRFYASRPQRLD
jgi:hypothetical protein